MNRRAELLLASVAIIIGYGTLIYVDWRIAVGVLFCIFANNLEQKK